MIGIILMHFGATGPSQLSNKTGKKVVGRRLPKALRNTNPYVVDYIGPSELSPLEATTTIRRFGRNLR
jgi:hypothetical protein